MGPTVEKEVMLGVKEVMLGVNEDVAAWNLQPSPVVSVVSGAIEDVAVVSGVIADEAREPSVETIVVSLWMYHGTSVWCGLATTLAAD